jgi:Flp pilus assembly protein TadD
MRTFAICAAAAASLGLGACAGSVEAPLAEAGYPRGALAAAAIDRGDYAQAEVLLEERSPLSEAHPARLMNLGTVYARTGRMELAREAWVRVLRSDREMMVATGEGRYVSTRQLAREALATISIETAAR